MRGQGSGEKALYEEKNPKCRGTLIDFVCIARQHKRGFRTDNGYDGKIVKFE